nr:MAG TPA: hypothetical protein [Caudoviricetes sp.]
MTYKYQNGIERYIADQVVNNRDCCRQGLVEMTDGRVFFTHRGYNDRVAPHLEVLICKKTGVHFNVNYNNGIAYKTHL